ncbi:MAG: hypothetical protein HRU41_06055 [Saprospiraceae bacterium]|nr:hypothetical protein [Saprospiraceae bacterium]
MKKALLILIICCLSFPLLRAQHFGDFPKIKKENVLNDLEILYQALDKFHSGMYWYTPKDSVDLAFQAARNEITDDLNVLEFHKLMAPLVALSREDHTNIYLPESIKEKVDATARFIPLTFVFLGKALYCVRNGSNFADFTLEGKQVESINGEVPATLVNTLGSLFASDGYIKTVKYSDLEGFNFSRYYYYYYGQQDQIEIKLKGIKEPIIVPSLNIATIIKNLRERYKKEDDTEDKDPLEYKILSDSIAYIGVHTFSNSDIREQSKEKNLKTFLRNSFRSIEEQKIKTLVVDMSENSGGSEGNEGLMYSYFGENYQKYKKVRANTQKAILDNGVDKPITLKTFGFLERILVNTRQADGSYERKEAIGRGLKAYKKEPEQKFTGKVYVIISPVTYSGGSEFSNMMYSRGLATFVGQETGGGYLGNTSGYSEELVLPHSKIRIYVPALQFVMNVEPKLPIGAGVIPHYEVIPTFEQYSQGVNASLQYILTQLENEK